MKYFIRLVSEYEITIDADSIDDAIDEVEDLYIDGDLVLLVGKKSDKYDVDYSWVIEEATEL
jgi:hypothetical protein